MMSLPSNTRSCEDPVYTEHIVLHVRWFSFSASDRKGIKAGPGVAAGGYPIGKGCDLFISVWNLHRSPHLWRDPDDFRPSRFSEDFANHDFEGAWAGYRSPPPLPAPQYVLLLRLRHS